MFQFRMRALSRLATTATLCVGLFAPVSFVQAQGSPAPDGIQGVWWPVEPKADIRPLNGPISYTSEGIAALARNEASLKAETGKAKERDDLKPCLPAGQVRILQQPLPLQIIQKGPMVVLIYEHNHVFEVVYLGDRPGEADKADPSYMGYSAGTWAKDALVVATANFNEQTMLSDKGIPHSDKLSVTRKLRKIDGGKQLEVLSTITDPVMFKKPWTVRQLLVSRPDTQIEEYTCGQGTFETRYTRQAASR